MAEKHPVVTPGDVADYFLRRTTTSVQLWLHWFSPEGSACKKAGQILTVAFFFLVLAIWFPPLLPDEVGIPQAVPRDDRS
jgi:hypothetical protein